MKKDDLKKIIKSIIKQILEEIDNENNLKEMTTTGDVAGYNIPAAFSKKGGSKRALDGSKKLGYTLTNLGKKDNELSADKL